MTLSQVNDSNGHGLASSVIACTAEQGAAVVVYYCRTYVKAVRGGGSEEQHHMIAIGSETNLSPMKTRHIGVPHEMTRFRYFRKNGVCSVC